MQAERLSAKLGRSVVLYKEGRAYYYWHWCPACKELHHYTVVIQEPWARPRWKSAGSFERPTFTPSMKITWGRGRDMPALCCHYFLTDGVIQFQSDCTHELKGKTVPLPDIPARYWEGDRNFF